MNETQIEWVKNPDCSQGYTHNPLSGCENHTPEGLCLDGLFPCYAYKLAHTRLKQRYLANDNFAPVAREQDGTIDLKAYGEASTDPFYPRFWEERCLDLTTRRMRKHWREPRGIFVCDMGDLFGNAIPKIWQERVFDAIERHPHDRFYLLTKQPQNLIKWSPFPENCWVGVTVCNADMFLPATDALDSIEATKKYISFEPLLENPAEFCEQWSEDLNATIDWLIIGACTGTHEELWKLCKRYPDLTIRLFGNKWTAQPKIEWLQEIVEAADKAGLPVFLKDNLKPLLIAHPDCWDDIPQGDHPNCESIAMLRQEMPETGP